MSTYLYKGFEIRDSNGAKTVDVRRYYPTSVHKGFPQDWIRVVENAPSQAQASKATEDYIARENRK